MSLDHGIINVPLSKRGNINAQLDRYTREQRAAAEASCRESRLRGRALRTDALALIGRLTDAQIAQWADRIKCPVRSVRKRLRGAAGVDPDMVVRVLRKEVA